MLAAEPITILSSESSSSRSLRNNYMDALAQSPAPVEITSSGVHLSSPESSSSSSAYADGFTLEMSDLMLPASALESELFGVPQDSGATVVSSGSSDESLPPPSVVTTTTSRTNKRKSSAASERRHVLPSTLLLSQSPLGEAVTQPVPEFLCHLFSMLRDPSYSDLISWSVPTSDEPDHMGGGIRGIGKIVVHQPEALQESVLGRYYRHSKYASFQRQLNYFGFKKRLHGGKKGKLSPCSYIHERLNEDVGSLFTLKRRPPAKKRASMQIEKDADTASVVSNDDATATMTSPKSSKKRRVTVEGKITEKKSSKKSSSSKKNRSKRDNDKQGKRQVVVSSIPIQVKAEEFSAPSPQSSLSIESNQYPVMRTGKQILVTPTPVTQFADSSAATPIFAGPSPVPSNNDNQQTMPIKPSSAPASELAQPTLLEMLSTSLPPSDVLFNDELDMDSLDQEGIPTWVTDDGQHHYHNVDSSLVDLAMLY